jgi:hypothetical protein
MKRKANIITQKSPDLIDDKKYIYRYEDIYVTPEELLLRNFSENDINIIKSNPAYFLLDKELFNEDFIQQKRLSQTIEEEERIRLHIKEKNGK